MKKLMVLITACLFSLSSWALDIDTAKAQGMIGERLDGYLGLVVNNADAEVLIKSINTQRRQKYREISINRGAELRDIEKLAGAKLVEKAQSEKHYYQNENGKWAR